VVEIELQYRYFGSGQLVVPIELAGFCLATSRAIDLLDTYYDTESLALRQAGCSLRLRQAQDTPQPLLIFKGPARRRRDGAKERQEIEVPIDHLPGGGEEIARTLAEVDLLARIAKGASLERDAELHEIGRLANRRSSHVYTQGLHRLEATWDRLTYPVGESEVRLEVEAHSRASGRYLARADRELRSLFAADLVPAPQGKSRELCARLYPELLEAA
jgi:inorganic triphosphatase YgiF